MAFFTIKTKYILANEKSTFEEVFAINEVTDE